jgi:hypothetical protein
MQRHKHGHDDSALSADVSSSEIVFGTEDDVILEILLQLPPPSTDHPSSDVTAQEIYNTLLGLTVSMTQIRPVELDRQKRVFRCQVPLPKGNLYVVRTRPVGELRIGVPSSELGRKQ